MKSITDFKDLLKGVQVRTKEVTVEIDGGPVSITVRELSGAKTMELMRRSPNTIQIGEQVITDNSTSQLDMAFVVAYAAVKADNPYKPLNPKEGAWSSLPARIIRPLFEAALEISGLGGDDSEEAKEELGNENDDS